MSNIAGPLQLTKVFDVGIALADALAAAHEKGPDGSRTILRDVKARQFLEVRCPDAKTSCK